MYFILRNTVCNMSTILLNLWSLEYHQTKNKILLMNTHIRHYIGPMSSQYIFILYHLCDDYILCIDSTIHINRRVNSSKLRIHSITLFPSITEACNFASEWHNDDYLSLLLSGANLLLHWRHMQTLCSSRNNYS